MMRGEEKIMSYNERKIGMEKKEIRLIGCDRNESVIK